MRLLLFQSPSGTLNSSGFTGFKKSGSYSCRTVHWPGTPRQEGLIHLDQASVYLPLKEGENDVQLVVSEVFGGWGLMAQFDDPTGLVIEP